MDLRLINYLSGTVDDASRCNIVKETFSFTNMEFDPCILVSSHNQCGADVIIGNLGFIFGKQTDFSETNNPRESRGFPFLHEFLSGRNKVEQVPNI